MPSSRRSREVGMSAHLAYRTRIADAGDIVLDHCTIRGDRAVNRTLLLLALEGACLVPATTLANNTSFLPGDAFFFVRLDEADIAALAGVESPVLTYGDHWDSGFFCGHAGFAQLRVERMPQSMKQHLLEAFRRFGPDLEEDARGEKRISVFRYNDDYDWHEYQFGIQYNENWVEETAKFGHEPEYVRLESFISTERAVMTSWRDAQRVPPLDVSVPPIDEEAIEDTSSSPVVLSGRFQLLVLPNRDFDEYFEYEAGTRLIEISDEGIRTFVADNSQWKEE
jgi:hypothetical protein